MLKRTFVAASLVVALSAGAGFAAASDFVGKYKTTDTDGKPMEITLSQDGTATGQRADESLTGKWKTAKKDENVAVIRWKDDWVTRITKSGDAYTKVAYKKGKPDEAEKSEITKIE
jgi:C-terminal lipocalin-like domain